MEVLIVVGVLLVVAYVVRGGTPALPPSPFPPTYTGPSSYSREIQDVARAIASAEGFFIPGTAPNRAHNPGAIKVPGWQGPTTGSEGISVFNSDDEGWSALYRQLQLIVDGRSSVYSLSMSIQDMAQRWTATQQGEWGSNVARVLGVTTSTPLQQVLT